MVERALAVLVIGVAALAANAQKVWVVAPTPGPGVDFTLIQDAVDAAVSGDIVLVRAGTYPAFTIPAKGLVVAADGPVTLTDNAITGLTIRDVGANQSVVVRGFDYSTSNTPLTINACAGPVTVEQCNFALSTASPFLATAGVVYGSDAVTLTRCTFLAFAGYKVSASGLSMAGSNVHLYECAISGGGAPSGGPWPGSPGATVNGGFLFAAATTFRGGSGSDGFAFSGFCLVPPGDGGDALVLTATTAYLHGTTLLPGLAGLTATGCAPANNGQPIGGSGTAHLLAGPTGSLITASPIRAGSTAALVLQGPAGFLGWLLLSAAQSPMFVGGCNGSLLPTLAGGVVVVAGTFPSSGQITVNVPVPPAIGIDGIPLFLQMAVTDASTGCFLGTPTALLAVESRF